MLFSCESNGVSLFYSLVQAPFIDFKDSKIVYIAIVYL